MEERHGDNRSALWQVAGLLVITLLAYWPAIQGGFIWDDDDYVIENETLRSFDGLVDIWTDPSATPQYYPLVHSSFWIEYQLWGLWPSGYHAVNVLIHAINAILLWRLLLWLGVRGAFFAAIVFAIHPVHVESVAWITERKNVLQGLFYFSSLLCYLRCWDFTNSDAGSSPGEPKQQVSASRTWYVLAIVCFFFALLSKTVAATLPAAILVLIWWKRGRIELRNVIPLIPMFVLGIGFGLMTVWLEKNQVGASGIDWELTLWERVLIAGRAIVFYASKIVWPVELIFTYPRWGIDTSQIWQWFFPIAVLATMIGLRLIRKRIGRGPLAAILLFAGTLFPALGFLDVYPMRFSFVADHFQYLASVAIIALIVSVATRLLDRSEPVKWVAASIVTVLLFVATWQQGKIYEGLEVLWRDTLAKNPTSFMAHNNLGALLNRRGDFEEAEGHLRQTLEIKPGFVDAVVNLGKALEGQQQFDQALQYYGQAAKIDPSLASPHNGLGAVYGMMGKVAQSERHLQRALQLDPDYANAYSNLGTLYASEEKWSESEEALEEAIRLDPGLGEAKSNLAKVYMSQQKFAAAQRIFEELAERNPDDVATLLNLGVVVANQQKINEAIGYFEQVLALNPNHVRAHYNLGAMYEANGERGKAESHFRIYEQLNTP